MTGRRALTALAIPLLIAAGLLGGTSPAHACSCAPQPLRQQAADAQAVFAARVVGPAEGRRGGWSAEVTSVFKGPVSTFTTITREDPELACGPTVGEGRRYLVLGKRVEGATRIIADDSFTVGACSGMRSLPARGIPAAVGSVLGPSEPAVPVQIDAYARDLHPPAQSVVPTWSLWAGGLGLAGLGAAGVLLLRRRHR